MQGPNRSDRQKIISRMISTARTYLADHPDRSVTVRLIDGTEYETAGIAQPSNDEVVLKIRLGPRTQAYDVMILTDDIRAIMLNELAVVAEHDRQVLAEDITDALLADAQKLEARGHTSKHAENLVKLARGFVDNPDVPGARLPVWEAISELPENSESRELLHDITHSRSPERRDADVAALTRLLILSSVLRLFEPGIELEEWVFRARTYNGIFPEGTHLRRSQRARLTEGPPIRTMYD